MIRAGDSRGVAVAAGGGSGAGSGRVPPANSPDTNDVRRGLTHV